MRREQISERLVQASQGAFRLAAELQHGFVGSEHYLYALSREEGSIAAAALNGAGITSELIREYIEKYDEDARAASGTLLTISEETQKIGEIAAERIGNGQLYPEHVLEVMMEQETCAAFQMVQSLGAVPERIADRIRKEMKNDPSPERQGQGKKKKKHESGQILEKYTRDLNALADEGKFDPLIGRDKEVQRMVQILSRRTKNNPVLIGEPGVGKTAIAEGLAQRIQEGSVPKNLLDKRILSLEMTKLLSGAKFRGDFEERMEGCIEEAKQSDDIILFIDELHTLIGAGAAEGAMDAANILKPALGRGEVQIIGSTTLDEYRKRIEKDSALERRFQPITVAEPSEEDAFKILMGVRSKYEEFHETVISEDAVRAAVELSARYIQDRYLPDKAIDLMDEAVSRVKTNLLTMPPHLKEMEQSIQSVIKEKNKAVKNQEFELAAQLRDQEKALRYHLDEKQKEWYGGQGNCVREEDIAATVSEWTGIPVTTLTQSESDRLLHLEDVLHQRIIGQDEAVQAVAKAIRRSRTAIREPNHPIGSFLFLGPTGVGKTELAKTLAEVMFHDRNAVIRVDMSEYMEKHTVSKFIGSPPGYVGYDEGGQLTERVRRKPYSIILFDEIEKAHPDVWNILLQIMDEGRLTDAQGRTVNFKNTILIMTSNTGAERITKPVSLGFGGQRDGDTRPVEEIRAQVMDELKRTFAPEFLNRLDEIIVFHQLEKEHIRKIARQVLDGLTERSAKLGMEITVDEAAIDILAEQGFDPVNGARPLRRTIQSTLEDAIAEKMLDGSAAEGCEIIVSGNDGEIDIQIKEKVFDIPGIPAYNMN